MRKEKRFKSRNLGVHELVHPIKRKTEGDQIVQESKNKKKRVRLGMERRLGFLYRKKRAVREEGVSTGEEDENVTKEGEGMVRSGKKEKIRRSLTPGVKGGETMDENGPAIGERNRGGSEKEFHSKGFVAGKAKEGNKEAERTTWIREEPH